LFFVDESFFFELLVFDEDDEDDEDDDEAEEVATLVDVEVGIIIADATRAIFEN
jgi:hypothetical protein